MTYFIYYLIIDKLFSINLIQTILNIMFDDEFKKYFSLQGFFLKNINV